MVLRPHILLLIAMTFNRISSPSCKSSSYLFSILAAPASGGAAALVVLSGAGVY